MPARIFARLDQRRFARALAALLVVDLALIGLWCGALLLQHVDVIARVPPLLQITLDWSLGEIANYAKWAAIALLMLHLWWQRQVAMFLAMAAVFAILLADDALLLHERGGALLASRLGLEEILGLRATWLTSLAVWALLGLAALAAISWGFLRSPPQHRGLGAAMLAAIAGLALCGVAVDFLASLADASDARFAVAALLHLLEDGGEMAFASLACAIAIASHRWEAGAGRAGRAIVPRAGLG